MPVEKREQTHFLDENLFFVKVEVETYTSIRMLVSILWYSFSSIFFKKNLTLKENKLPFFSGTFCMHTYFSKFIFLDKQL